MHSVTKNSIEMSIGRFLATLFVGILAGALTNWGAQHFQYTLDPRWAYLVGSIFALGTWFVSRKVFEAVEFADQAMRIQPAPVPAYLHNGRLGKDAGAADETDERAADCSACSVELTSAPQADGSIDVTAVVAGLRKTEFSAMRARAERVSGITWLHPKNLEPGRPAGKRVMTGKVLPGNGQDEAMRKLEVILGKRV